MFVCLFGFFFALSSLPDLLYQSQLAGPFETGGPALSPPGGPRDEHHSTVCWSASLRKVQNDWISPVLVSR